jgi:glycosyltransferase involved in cell wall biosynthesis
MRVLVFHGYLLRGTGSNVYNASLASALLRLGHEVHLVCQERHAAELQFVGAVGSWDTGELVVEQIRPSGCTLYRPDIGALLPVYVPDRYEGIEARPFQELSDAELELYLDANVRALRDVFARTEPDVALANHLVMGPLILARALAGVPYAVKIHGSALEYTVKPYPRFLKYAREGIAGASGVLVGSRHTAESLWQALSDSSLPARTRLGPPGVDIHRFRPLEREAALAKLRGLGERITEREQEPAGSGFGRDSSATAKALAALVAGAEEDRLVAFVGKLIVSKGIDLLLLAWPLVLADVPAARLAVIGFGAYSGAVQRLIDALSEGDLAAIRALAREGRAAEGGPASKLEFALSFLDYLKGSGERKRYLAAAAHMRERVVLTGRLEHDELADVLPACEAVVVPSTFPESFGMVAVEGSACGALPISAAHSGLAEVSRTLAATLPEAVRELVSFPVDSDVVQSIANRLIGWLRADEELRATTRTALVDTTAARYSWEGVARGVIAGARGELAELEVPE